MDHTCTNTINCDSQAKTTTLSPPFLQPTTAILDTGSTAHFFAIEAPLLNKQETQQPIHVELPDHSMITSTHTGELNLPQLPKAARQVHMFPSLGNTSLISVGQLCDCGCFAHLGAQEATITYKDKVLLRGERNHKTKGLWTLQLNTIHQSHAAINHSATAPELVAFAHASLFSPAISTLQTALDKGYLPPIPGLTSKLLRKYPPTSSATIKGHLDTTRKNSKSTKQTTTYSQEEIILDYFPQQTTKGKRTNLCYATTMNIRRQVSSDLTGRFPVPSSSGNHYLLVVYDYDSNAILMQPTPNRKAESLVATYEKIHKRLTRGGCTPILQRLDNEASQAFKDFLMDNHIDYQLVPPADHRRNSAEQAIRTGKNHLIAGWASTDPNFPMHLWDKTVAQAELTLNLL